MATNHSPSSEETKTPLLKTSSGGDYASINHAAASNSAALDEDKQQQSKQASSSSSAAASSSSSSSSPPLPLDAHSILLQSSLWEWNNSAPASAPHLSTLTRRALSLAIGNKATHLHMDDIVGVQRGKKGELCIHSYAVAAGGCCSSSSGKGGKRAHMLTTLRVLESSNAAASSALVDTWYDMFQQLLQDTWITSCPLEDDDGNPLPPRTRSLLLLINPASGAGNAEANLHTLTPMLQQSGVRFRVQKTSHANHALEILRDMDVRAPEAPTDVICVSGDGLVHEVVNGIMQRQDWEVAARYLRIGHIGGGSGNGLASAICVQAQESIDLVSSMWLILKGWTRPLDVFSIKQEEEDVRYGFLSMGYGMISDIDLESESMRYLGNARFTVAALARICCVRRYEASMELLVEAGSGVDNSHSQSATSKCKWKEDGCENCSSHRDRDGVGRMHSSAHTGRRELAKYLMEEGLGAYSKRNGGKGGNGDLSSIAVVSSSSSSSSSSSPTPALEWQSLDSAFTLVWSMNVSHGASDMYVSPYSHFSDGCMDVYYCKSIGKCSLLSLFLSMESGTHGDNEDIHRVKVRGLRLQPRKDERRSEITVDGERLPYKAVEIRVFRGVINLLAR